MAKSSPAPAELPMGPQQRAATERLGEEVASSLRAVFHGMEPEERKEIRRILQAAEQQTEKRSETVAARSLIPIEGVLPEDRIHTRGFKAGEVWGYGNTLRDICSLTYERAR